MKIVMLMSVYGERAVGGAERTAGQMAKLLVLRGHSVHLLSLSPMGQVAPALVNEEGVICDSIPLSQLYDPYSPHGDETLGLWPQILTRIWGSVRKAFWHIRDLYNPTMVLTVRQKLRSIQPDILFTHTLQGFSVGVWGAARSLGIKVVHMAHDHALICPGTAMTRGASVCERVCGSCAVFSLARRNIAARPDAIVGPSAVILARHRQFGWFRDVTQQQVIPNALPITWTDGEASILPSQTKRNHRHPIVFGFLGRIDASKGVDTLIEAVSLLPEALLGRWQLLLGGHGSKHQLEAWVLATRNGSQHWALISPYVECLGLVKADDFINKLDVLIAPSRAHETFCNVVMEAASLGRPAIVSNRGALPERVCGGTSGWIFTAGDASALAAQIQAIIEMPVKILEKAQAALKTKFLYAPSLQIDSVERLLVKVLNG